MNSEEKNLWQNLRFGFFSVKKKKKENLNVSLLLIMKFSWFITLTTLSEKYLTYLVSGSSNWMLSINF